MLLPLLGVIVLAKTPAWDVEPHGGKLLVVDDGFLTVTALDAGTGKRAWTTKVHAEANGRHTLIDAGAHVLAWFGEDLVALDSRTGKAAYRDKRGYNGVEWNDGGCWLDIADTVAAQRCQCSFQLFDPATNKDIGARYQKQYVEMHELDANGGRPMRSGGCWGSTDTLFGVAANTALITTSERGSGRGRANAAFTAGIDVTSGKERWRQPTSSPFAGHAPDGSLCWFYGFVDPLYAVDCTTGATAWRSTPLPAHGAHAVTYVPGPRPALLDVRMPAGAAGVAELRDAKTGAVRWSTKLAAGTLAWTAGVLPVLLTRSGETVAQVLAPTTGKPLVTIPLGSDGAVIPDRDGAFFVVTAAAITAYDSRGNPTAKVTISNAGLTVGESLVVARLDTELIVLDRRTLQERGRIPGTYAVVHVEGALGAKRIAVFDYDGKTLGTVSLLRID